jgi:integrase
LKVARKLTGIRRLSDSYEVYGKVGEKQFSRRFPHETSLSVMRVWRSERIRGLRDEQPRKTSLSLSTDVERFLKSETGARRDNFEYLLTHWIKAFEDKPRALITSTMIQAQLDKWHVEGVAASTLNHRRQALRTMYRRLEPDMPTPVDRTRGYKQPDPQPRAIPEDVIEKVFAVMPDSATKARLLTICHTGMRHSELMRVRPEHVVLEGENAHVFVSSGKGGRHRVVPLHSAARDAFRLMASHDAWGTFSQASARKTWLLACSKVGVPAGLYRPYDLRHRFASRLRERGADLADVQELLGHKNINTTRRYAPVVHAKLRMAVATLMEDQHDEERSA